MFALAFISFTLVPGSTAAKRMFGERVPVHFGTANPKDQEYATRKKEWKYAHVAKKAHPAKTTEKTKVKKRQKLKTARTVEGVPVFEQNKVRQRKQKLQRARVAKGLGNGHSEQSEEKVHGQQMLRQEHQWLAREQERLRREHLWLAREQQREQERLKREQEEQQRLATKRQIELDHAYALELLKEQEKKEKALKRRQKAAELVGSKELSLENMKEWYSKLREIAPISDEVKESFKTLNKEAAEAKVISVHEIKTAILERFPDSHMVRCFHDNTKSTVQYDRRGIHVLRGGFPISKKAVTEIYEKRMLPRALKWQQSKNPGEHFFCCRDFASVFTAVCKEEQIIATNCPEQFAIGEVMLKGYFPHLSEPVDMFGHNGCHMINIICDRDADNKVVVHLLEPQSGNFIEPGSFENYDNGIMFVVF